MPTHLPLLLNPLLNAIFNNPQPAKSPLKDIYSNLSKGWEDGIVILVPSLNILLNYADKESGIPYRELCYSEEFLKDHIITTNESRNAKLFTTFSKKEVLVKKDLLFTGKGFKRSLRLKIQSSEFFHNFNDYFEKGRRVMIMYIEGSLYGTPEKLNILELITPSNNAAERIVVNDISESSPKENESTEVEVRNSLDSFAQNETLKFEQILRTFPLVSKSIGEKFETLFRKFNVKDSPDFDSLIEVFTETINLSSHIFKTLSPELIDSILDISPSLDLNECIFDYVELNLCDKLWNRLCELNQDFLTEHYDELEFLSLNQVSLPSAFKHNLSLQAIVEKRIAQGISEFKKLDLAVTTVSKVKILVNTINLLSNIESLTVDADTLVGLLLMVVVHSKVPNLENHLLYIQSFSFQNIDLGLIGYSLSTLEGVLYYLKDQGNINILKSHSTNNRKVISFIDSKELISLKELADTYIGNADSSLKSRTINGESVLMLTVLSNDYDTWKLLIDYEKINTLEDILSDTTINNANLLNVALNFENYEIVDDMIEILLSSCTVDELVRYFNMKDIHKRTIGHYLFHYKEIIPKIGFYVNWLEKDLNGQTPLFSVCRSYDTPKYSEMIRSVFDTVDKWYIQNGSLFDYEDHIDNRGNTLLHILNSDVGVLLKYRRVNLNESNKKSYTPLMVYAKYNRIENIENVINDERINVLKPDKNHFTCLDQSKNEQVSKLLEGKVLADNSPLIIGKQIGIIRIKLENNEWTIIIRGQIDGTFYTTSHSFSDFKNLIELIQIEFPNTFLPLDYVMKNFKINLNIPFFNKLKINKIIEQLNIFLGSLLLNKPFLQHELLWEFLVQKEFHYASLLDRTQTKFFNFKQDLLNNLPKINGNSETPKEQLLLQPEEISEMNFFLKFSTREISKLRNTYDKFLKVVNFSFIKTTELNKSVELFTNENSIDVKELVFLKQVWLSSSKEFSADDHLCNMVLYLSLAADEIVKKSNVLLNEKIYKWWKLYGELIELNNNYKRFKYVEMKKNTKHDIPEIPGLVDVNEESFNNFTNDTSFSLNGNGGATIKKQKPSFLTNFIESKRNKYEAKLLAGLSEVKKRLYELNKDMKFNHETLAMEMNNFLIFKTEHLKSTIRAYVLKQIRDLKFNNVMLQRGLEDLKLLDK